MTPPWIGSLLSARVYDLEQPRHAGMPIFPAHRPGYFYALHRRHRDTYQPAVHGARSSASGMLTMMEHTGTHIEILFTFHYSCEAGGVGVRRARFCVGHFHTRARGRSGEPVAPRSFSGMPTKAKL
jgi:hypothetical protein